MNEPLPLQPVQSDSSLLMHGHGPLRNKSHNVLFDTELYEKNIYNLKNKILEEAATLNEEWLTTHGFEKINHAEGYSYYHHKAYKLSIYLDPYWKIEWLGYKTNCFLNVKSLKVFVSTLYYKDL
jgi:hypothetical protein